MFTYNHSKEIQYYLKNLDRHNGQYTSFNDRLTFIKPVYL